MQAAAFAQIKYYSSVVTDTISINFVNQYSVSQVSVVPFSEIIVLRGHELKKQDYKFSYTTGTFKLSDSLRYSLFDTLFVTYKTIDLALQKEYKKRKLVTVYNKELGDTVQTLQSESSGFSAEDIFGSNVQKSGTIVRGFTVGTNKDFSLNSGLRLQLSGKLSKDIEVVAALTDENTPIQPEGNTEKLQELDKVFIQIKHPYATGTFGDYVLNEKFGEFGNVSRKLQGLLGEFNYGGYQGYVAFASARGKFNTNQFNGSDGVQGPYQLTGSNSEPDIIVIAGTEKVYVDGIEMKRGENNDYTIEYSNATITFTPNRLITSASRITVDFEYSDNRYSRNFFGTGIQSGYFDDKVNLKFQYIREGDNQDSPIDITLSNSDKAILAKAGDNRLKAVKSGVMLAQPDSLGRIIGIYTKVDTLIDGKAFSYYKYAPGDSSSKYNVSFSFVGDNQGDYFRQSLGVYSFAGIGKGNYLPEILLPLPELKQLGNLVLNLAPYKGVTLDLEYAGSLWDQNRFSSLDDQNNYGYARNIHFNLVPQKLKLGSVSLGKVGLSYKDRFVQDRFTSIDRFDNVEFDRYYNIGTNVQSESETLREIGLTLIPVDELNINSTFGFVKHGDNFNSNRYDNTLHFTNDKIDVSYNLDYVNSKNIDISSYWLRQTGSVSYKIWKLRPGIDYLAEDKKDKKFPSDSLLISSLKYSEYDPFIELTDFHGFKLTTKYSIRNDFLPLNGLMAKQAKSIAQFYTLNYSGIREVNTTLNITYRKKSYTDTFKKLGNLDNETILVRSQSNFRFWDPILNGNFYYEVQTQKTAKLQKVFVKVAQGTGNYKYLGDLNNNGIADENEFAPTIYDGDYVQLTVPTDQLYPVINLQTSTRWKVEYADIFDKHSIVGFLFQPLSTETSWRVEENTREMDYKKIYLLDFAAFQDPENTIHGSNFIQQDIYLFENDPEFSLRFRYAQTKSLDQYSDGVFRSYNRERSVRIKFRMIKEVSNQTDITASDDQSLGPANSNRNRLIGGNSVITDFSYQPANNVEIDFKIEVAKSQDSYPQVPTIINKNAQTITVNLSFVGNGRLNFQIERDELIANTSTNEIPFELLEGNSLGKNYLWQLNFDYKLAANLQSSVSYNGRVQGGGKVIHTARAEVRAFF